MFLIDRSYYKIKKTKKKGRGVFCKKEIKAKTIIGEYTGSKVKIAEYDLDKDKIGLYLMFLNDKYAIYPDLKTIDIHLINHSCEPNCWIVNHNNHIYFFALRDIKKGEELTISYLLPPKDETCNPCTHICKCGSKKCTGTMHLSKEKFKKWQKFQESLKYRYKNIKLLPIPKFENEDAERDFWDKADSSLYFDWSKFRHVKFPNLKLSSDIKSDKK